MKKERFGVLFFMRVEYFIICFFIKLC